MLSVAKASGAYAVAITGNPDSPLARVADEVLIAAAPEGYLKPADLSARHCQLFVVDLLYLLDRAIEFRPHHAAARRLRRRRGAAPPAAARRGLVPAAARAGPVVQRTELMMTDLTAQYLKETTTRLERLAGPNKAIDDAVALIADALEAGGVIQAFGTGHSEAFAMEIAGRAGGLIATNKLQLRTLVLRGDRSVSDLGGAEFERDPNIGENLLALFDIQPNDVFIIASNSGVNGSILGVALAAKARGHKVIAVTSMDHTMRVTPKHPSGKRLSEVADVVIDNLAPFGDSTMSSRTAPASAPCPRSPQPLLRSASPSASPRRCGSAARNHRSISRPTFRAVTSTTVLSKISTASGSAGRPKRLAGPPDVGCSNLNDDKGRTGNDNQEDFRPPHVPQGNRGCRSGSAAQRPAELDRAFAQDAANPFGVAEGSTVDAVIFNGGYGIDYVEFAARTS